MGSCTRQRRRRYSASNTVTTGHARSEAPAPVEATLKLERASDDDSAERGEPLQLEAARCCVCGHDDATPVAIGEDFEYRSSPDQFLALRCRDCGLVYLKLRPATSEYDRIHAPVYRDLNSARETSGLPDLVRRRVEARRVVRWCRSLPAGARILDIGRGDTLRLDALRKSGSPDWELERMDASEVEERVSATTDTYDLVLLIGVIEHVDDPPALLKAASELLRPGGRAVVVTENTATLSFRMFGRRYWGGYDFPRHWHLFDEKSLRSLAGAVGFDVERQSTLVRPVTWVSSIRNALTDLGGPAWLVNRFTSASPVSMAAFTLFDWLQQLAGHGGLLRAVLRKPDRVAGGSGGPDATA